MALTILDNTATARQVLEVQDLSNLKFVCVGGVIEPIVSSDASIDGSGHTLDPLTVNIQEALQISETDTSCGAQLTFSDSLGNDFLEVLLGKRALHVSPGPHGIPIGSVAPIKLDPVTGQVSPAQADSENNVADFHAYVVNSTTVQIFEDGFHVVPSHGLVDLYQWHVVSPTAAGQYVPGSALVGENIIQEAVFPITEDCLFVDLQEARSPVNPCSIINSVAHGLSLPASGILPVRWNSATVKWVNALAVSNAESAKIFVVKIIDVDNFRIANPGVLNLPGHGLVVGETYYLSPTVAGAIVLESSLGPADCRQRVLTVLSNDCVFLNPGSLICP
jgi:hypothetical protein